MFLNVWLVFLPLVRVYDFKLYCFNKVFLVKFNQSSVYLRYLKIVQVFSGNQTMVACVRVVGIAITLVVFEMEWDSLINYCVIFHFACKLHFFKLFFQSENINSQYHFFSPALQFERTFILMCGIHFLSCRFVLKSSMYSMERKVCI